MAGRRGTAIWSPEALVDVDEIWNYYERVAGRNTPENILREIGEVVATVEDHPFVGRSRNELRPGFRSLAASPHVVFYRVVDHVLEDVRTLKTLASEKTKTTVIARKLKRSVRATYQKASALGVALRAR